MLNLNVNTVFEDFDVYNFKILKNINLLFFIDYFYLITYFKHFLSGII